MQVLQNGWKKHCGVYRWDLQPIRRKGTTVIPNSDRFLRLNSDFAIPFSQHTNIMRLYDHLIKDDNQIVFYHSGIGTYTRPSEKSMSWYLQVLGRSIDLAIAWYIVLFLHQINFGLTTTPGYRSFENVIIAAYEWLSENYRQGDRIFLFGKSSSLCTLVFA